MRLLALSFVTRTDLMLNVALLRLRSNRCGSSTKGPRKNKILFWRPDVLQIWAIGKFRNRRNSRAILRISGLADRPEM